MSAIVIETNSTPFIKVNVDPVTLDIIENALSNVRREMDVTLVRTAMSPGIREQGDAFPLIADREGRMVVGQLGSFIGGFLERYDGTLEEGDIIWLSDPYVCDGAISHNNDWLIILPIFFDGRLVGWSSMMGHQTDVGGKVPGSMPTDGTSIFQEGIRIPPVKIYRKGILNSELLELVLHQVRTPDWNRSDLNALIASCRTAEHRVQEICSRFGVDTFISTGEHLLDRNYRAVKQLIGQTISEVPVWFEDYVCDDGLGFGPYSIKCTMWREDEKIILDFDGTALQSPSSINFYLNENMVRMLVGNFMVMVFDPQIVMNDGFYPLIDVRIPDGTFIKPKFPAALSCRTHALTRVLDVLGALLGQKTPQFLNAAGTSSSPHLMFSGIDNSGDYFQLFQIGFGGIPARPHGDGPDGHSLWPDFTNVPNEFLERYFPMRIERYETVVDSGGPGKFRGGNGMRISYRFLATGTISIHDDRWFTYPWGVNGGRPGGRSSKSLTRVDGSIQVLPSKCDEISVGAGDVLEYITWGGGGWGDPLDRDAEIIALEVRRGLVTAEGASRYGVVMLEDNSVDSFATEALRETLRRERGATQLFDMGGSIDELRVRCLEETGLPAPRPPEAIAHRTRSTA